MCVADSRPAPRRARTDWVQELDPPRLVTRLDSALAELEQRREELNALNVFPVADGDTGDNIALTVRAVRDAAATLATAGTGAQPSAEETLARLARSALLGARGNSGVILAQWLRGAAARFSHEAAGASKGYPVPIAEMLRAGAGAARASVREPAPGTVLSVMDAMSEGAERAAGAGEAPGVQLERALDAGWRALERGRHELEALRSAGVIDAGGLGLLVLVSGALWAGRDDRERVPLTSSGGPAPTRHPGVPDRHRHCLNLVLSDTALESAALASRLEGFGDSLVVIGDPPDLRVHIHTDDPQGVVAACRAAGAVERVEVDDMVSQAALRAPA